MIKLRQIVIALTLLGLAHVLTAQGTNGGILYASDFAKWTLPTGNTPARGTLFWSNPDICKVSPAGYNSLAIKVGRPVKIVDADPSLTEIVTPTGISVGNSGCMLSATMAHSHSSYQVTSATAGLQEALDFQAKFSQGALIVLTPAWTGAGGTTSMITSATGSSSASILDERTAVIVPYTWNGSAYVAQSFGGSGTVNPGQQALAQYPNSAANVVNPSNITYDTQTGNNLTYGTAGNGNAYLGASIGSGTPLSDIRHPSFATGALCDGGFTHDIGPALQAAWNALPATGGEILIPGAPAWCYWANPNTFNWSGKTGPVTFKVQGTLRTGTTLTMPTGTNTINWVGTSAGTTVSFQGPGPTAVIWARPANNVPAIGTIGTAIAATYTGTGKPTSTLPIVCNAAANGATYQDTNATSADLWTCAVTTGSITSGTNSLTVGTVGGFVVGDPITVAGAGTSGGTLSTTITAISGTTFTLAANASTTVSGATTTDTFYLNTNGWRAGGVFTITPSSMNGIVAGTGLGIGGNTTCAVTSATRSGTGTVSATFPSSCHIQSGVYVAVAGCTDSSFNAASLLTIASDYVNNTLQWNQAGSATSTSSCTVTGLFEDNIEYVQVRSTTATTATAVFSRTHPATDTFAMIGVNVDVLSGGAKSMKDIKIISDGPGLWLQQDYESTYTNIGIGTTSCGNSGSITTPLIVGDASFIHIKGAAINSACMPWSLHMTQPYNQGYTGSGPIYLEDSFLVSGIKLDHGAAGITGKNLVFEQATGSMVLFDPTHYWYGDTSGMYLENVGLQDNPNGFHSCAIVYETPQLAVSGARSSVYLNGLGSATCVVNDYAAQSIKLTSQRTGTTSQFNSGSASSTPNGVVGVYNFGQGMEAELRGEGASMSPSIVPYATLAVNQDPTTWTATNCTVTSNALAPDGTLTAGNYVCTGSGATQVLNTSITPSVGDHVLYWAWVNTTTPNKKAVSGAVNSAIGVTNSSNPHWSFVSGTTTPNIYDAALYDDWYHVLVGVATVGTADGSAGNLTMGLNADTNAVMQFWKPGAIYLPASIPLKEVMRYREQLLHGCVPSSAATGIAYSCYPIQLPGDPTAPLQAATKQYVDAHTAFTPLTLDFTYSAAPAGYGCTSSGTNPKAWTCTAFPIASHTCSAWLIGGGGGGGSGAVEASGTNAFGGGGGAGGSMTYIPPQPCSFLGSGTTATVIVNVGQGGAGGAAQASSGSNGNGGTGGGYSSIVGASGFVAWSVGLGGTTAAAGAGGTTTTGNAGGASTLGSWFNQCAGTAGSSGTGVFQQCQVVNGGPSGGAGGGGLTAGPTAAAGGAQSATQSAMIRAGYTPSAYTAGSLTGGTVDGGAGQTPVFTSITATMGLLGAIGGTGGASSTLTNGGKGGDGMACGGGGAGGGAALNGSSSGAGGKGGDGCVRIVIQ